MKFSHKILKLKLLLNKENQILTLVLIRLSFGGIFSFAFQPISSTLSISLKKKWSQYNHDTYNLWSNLQFCLCRHDVVIRSNRFSHHFLISFFLYIYVYIYLYIIIKTGFIKPNLGFLQYVGNNLKKSLSSYTLHRSYLQRKHPLILKCCTRIEHKTRNRLD